MSDLSTYVDYRVRPVTRWVVTRYSRQCNSAGMGTAGASEQRGEYGNYATAFEVANALCKMEHETLGYPPGDERISYPPLHPDEAVHNASLGDPCAGPHLQSTGHATPGPTLA